MPEGRAALLREGHFKRGYGGDGDFGHGLIHDALKGPEVVFPIAPNVLERVYHAVVHDQPVAVPDHGPDARGLEVQEGKRRATVERHFEGQRLGVRRGDGLGGDVLVQHGVLVRRPHEPPRGVGPLAVLVRPRARVGLYSLVDLVVMHNAIPDLVRRAHAPCRGLVLGNGTGEEADGLRFDDLHARTPGIPSASHASIMSAVRRVNLTISDMEMSVSRRS